MALLHSCHHNSAKGGRPSDINCCLFPCFNTDQHLNTREIHIWLKATLWQECQTKSLGPWGYKPWVIHAGRTAVSPDQGWKVAVGRTARGRRRSITLIPDFLLTMYRSGSEVADSEDTGAIYSAEREQSMNTQEHSSAGCRQQAQVQNLHLLNWCERLLGCSDVFVPKDSYLLFRLQQSSKRGNITS